MGSPAWRELSQGDGSLSFDGMGLFALYSPPVSNGLTQGWPWSGIESTSPRIDGSNSNRGQLLRTYLARLKQRLFCLSNEQDFLFGGQVDELAT